MSSLSPSLHTKLDRLLDRHQEVAALLAVPEAATDQDRFRRLSREYAELDSVAARYQHYLQASQTIVDTRDLLAELDDGDGADMRQLANEELTQATAQSERCLEALRIELLPQDPNDHANVFLEIRAGTGGDEAGLFAGNLHRMYLRFAEEQGWTTEIVSASAGEHGGYREIITRVSGRDVYARLKFESGVHRVQRVPETESQGRIHTSACTVAVLPEADEIGAIEISHDDLRVDTFRASGAGGQHVNKTDSAVRLTHLPTGTVVECQDERSQHRNRERALALLSARLTSQARDQQAAEQASTRRLLVGSGDRSERIRTYNFPQGRVTDHRIRLTLHRLAAIMEGDLEPLLDPLAREHQADLLAALGDSGNGS